MLPQAKRIVIDQLNADSGTVTIDLPDSLREISLTDTGTASLFRGLLVKGADNSLLIGAHTDLRKVSIEVHGRNNRLIIGANCQLKGSIGIRGNDRVVVIGAHTTFNNVAIVCKYNGHVFIGRDCMFSSGIEVRTSDSHAIIDLDLNKTVNPSAGVYIGDHVWVGKDVVISKGVTVAQDNIIAMGAFVRTSFPDSQTIIAGTPAKVVRRRRSWSRNELVDPETTDIYAWKNYDLL